MNYRWSLFRVSTVAWVLGIAVTFSASVYADSQAAASQGSSSSSSQGSSSRANKLSGPNSVSAQIAKDKEAKALFETSALDSYYDWKERIDADYGFSISADYTAVYLGASSALPDSDKDASSGMVRIFGDWELVNRGEKNSGSLVYKVEHRHKYTDVPPSEFNDELGYAGNFEGPFNDQKALLSNLFWRQRFLSDRLVMLLGFLDPTDYVDNYSLSSPWLHFMNGAFGNGSNAIALPDAATFGLVLGGMITDNVYAIGNISDANADPTDPFQGFETFFNESEHFKSIELGWTTSRERVMKDSVHVTYWHADEREKLGTDSGWGLNFSASWELEDELIPFIRAGYADESSARYQRSISFGFGYRPFEGRDLFAIAGNWAEPNESVYGTGLSNEFTFESFYRIQLTRGIALTPDFQWIAKPALNPDKDDIYIFGLRARVAI